MTIDAESEDYFDRKERDTLTTDEMKKQRKN